MLSQRSDASTRQMVETLHGKRLGLSQKAKGSRRPPRSGDPKGRSRLKDSKGTQINGNNNHP